MSAARRLLGLGLLLLVIVAVVAVQLGRGQGMFGAETPTPAAIVVRGTIGSEKANFLRSEPVQRILRDRYGLAVDFTTAGSLDQVRADTAGKDFLWPGSEVALEVYREVHGAGERSAVIFNSPIVLYAWSEVTAALVKAGLAEQRDGVYYVTDFPKLVRMMDAGQPWSDVGLPQLYGGIAVFTSDPTKSNSGNQFAALLATTLNNGQVVDERSLETVLPALERYYARLGFLNEGSADLFNQFLSQGVGARPIIAGYESQLVEFSLQNEQYRQLLNQRINVLYPTPTVWSRHILIALTPNGTRLMEALQDPELQRIAWEQHGFRSGLIGAQNDPKVLAVGGVPATISAVVPMPKAAVMDRLIHALSSPPGSGGTPAAALPQSATAAPGTALVATRSPPSSS